MRNLHVLTKAERLILANELEHQSDEKMDVFVGFTKARTAILRDVKGFPCLLRLESGNDYGRKS